MGHQTLIFCICLFIHAMLISVTSKLQNKTKTFILYPVIIINFARSFLLSDKEEKCAKSIVLFLVFVEMGYFAYIVRRMEKYCDSTDIVNLFVLFSMMCAEVLYLDLDSLAVK